MMGQYHRWMATETEDCVRQWPSFYIPDSHSKSTIVDDLAERLESTWSLLTKYPICA